MVKEFKNLRTGFQQESYQGMEGGVVEVGQYRNRPKVTWQQCWREVAKEQKMALDDAKVLCTKPINHINYSAQKRRKGKCLPQRQVLGGRDNGEGLVLKQGIFETKS